MDNAVVLDNYRILNEDGLRFKDELVRHKMLDAIGGYTWQVTILLVTLKPINQVMA